MESYLTCEKLRDLNIFSCRYDSKGVYLTTRLFELTIGIVLVQVKVPIGIFYQCVQLKLKK